MNQVCALKDKNCVPCEGGIPPLTSEQINPLHKEVPDWKVAKDTLLQKEYIWKNFKQALTFINKVGEIAESEGHHPDITLHDWNKVTLSLSTHAINGLSENDFILASKINTIHI